MIRFGDSQRLRQVVLNLLSNAVKFTPSGGSVTVELRARLRGGRGQREVLVSDTGIGIAPVDQALIFEAFRQVEGGQRATTRGPGLGWRW